MERQEGDAVLNLFVLDTEGDKMPVHISVAMPDNVHATANWKTQWTSKVALEMPDNDELLGLMAYIVDGRSFAAEDIYVESADHSNSNLLRAEGRP